MFLNVFLCAKFEYNCSNYDNHILHQSSLSKKLINEMD